VAKYAALLRGVNVGGNSLAMPDLVRVVEGLGGRDVQTYLQSGNVVFTGPKSVAAELEQALLTEVGVRSPVLVRSGVQLAAVAAAKPFPAEGKAVSVTFLRAPPAYGAVAGVDQAAYGADEFVVVGSEIYLHTPNGYGRSKLNNTFWERKLSTVATTRNWNTVLALAELTA
jgi:uncharacterized protein (DUF1697 family)